MKLTKEKKDQIRMALVAKTFSHDAFRSAAEPLTEALADSKGMKMAIDVAENFGLYVNRTSSVHIISTDCIYRNDSTSVSIKLPFTYARQGSFTELQIITMTADDGSHRFEYAGWQEAEKLPDLNGKLKPCLEKIVSMIQDRKRLDDKLGKAMEKISSPKILAEKIPATRLYLTEELESMETQSKALIPQDMVLRIRKMLGYAC